MATTPLAGAGAPLRHPPGPLGRARASPAAGLPLLLVPSLPPVLVGLVLVGVGTFFAQATATGFVGRAATTDRGVRERHLPRLLFFGGLVGAAVLGQLFDRVGWTACVAGIGAALGLAALLAVRLRCRHRRTARPKAADSNSQNSWKSPATRRSRRRDTDRRRAGDRERPLWLAPAP